MVDRVEQRIGSRGELVVFSGPMFARKTGSLIDHVEAESFADKEYIVVKPSVDTRYSLNDLVTHSGRKLEAYSVNTDCPEDIISLINSLREQGQTVDGIAIDEAQFFSRKEPERTIEVIEKILESGISVAAAGLPADFANRGFGAMPELMAKSDYLEQRTAKCQFRPDNNGGKRCGVRATKTQRIINGMPAHINDPVVLIGGKESYEVRCHNHWAIRRD